MWQGADHKLGTQRHDQRRLEGAGMTRQALAQIGRTLRQWFPGEIPIRGGGKVARVHQGKVSDDELNELVVPTVSVDDEDTAEAALGERLRHITERAVVVLGRE